MINETFSRRVLELSHARFVETMELNILYSIIMVTLCFVTTIGNICVIHRYKNGNMVNNKYKYLNKSCHILGLIFFLRF
jgi:hypothetical protein